MVKIARSEEDIIREAKDRYKRSQEWESNARENFIYDSKFCQGDSSNLYQWPDNIARARSQVDRPCLTINKTKQHCLQIINDQRQNESQVEIRPVGNGATYEAAKVFEGIVRHIEYQSNAQAAYSNATYSQVIAGIGYWRIVTDYANDETFDQEIYIRRVADPLSIYLDPDIQEFDGSDARFAFVSRDMSKDEFESEYGEMEDEGMRASPLGMGQSDGWEDMEHIRVCEYYRIVESSDKLHELQDGTIAKLSDINQLAKDNPKVKIKDNLKERSVRSRDIAAPKVEWYLIAGAKIIDRKDWAGKYIPIVRVVGEETVIDKKMDRKGHTRSLIDPQRIYNYWSSSAVEFVALQSKTPYIGSVESIEEYENEWRQANQENLSFLPYNATDDKGNKLDPPQRAQPPVMAPAYISGLQIAQQEMMMASGQYEANMGQKSNEVSGRAVQERQRQGDNATYQYIDHFGQSIRFTGRILVDLIPKIYDTAREMKILGIDGTQSAIQLDPNSQQSHQQLQDPDDEDYDPASLAAIFNPNVGIYEVEADIGPAFSTRRQDTFNALSQIIQADNNLMPIIGDLLFKAADFPMADEVAKRMKNMVPKQALGQAPDPQVGQLQQMLAQQHEVMAKQGDDLKKAQSKQSEMAQQRDIDWYQAETARMNVAGKIDPDALMPIIRQMVSQVLGTPVNALIAAHAQENEQMAGSDTQMQQIKAQQAQQQAAQGAQHASDLAAQNAQQAQAAQPKPGGE